MTASLTDCNLQPDHEFGHLTYTDARAFVREIFMDSDTDAGVLTLRNFGGRGLGVARIFGEYEAQDGV